MKRFGLIILVFTLALALLVTFMVSLISVIPSSELWIIFLIVFTTSLILIYLILRILILKDIKKLEYLVYNWLEGEEDTKASTRAYFFPGFERMDQSVRFVMEEKQKEVDELQTKSHFRREFIANISHELKTPLFSAQGFVHTLLDGAIKDKNVRTKFLKKAAKSLDGLDLLVQDLLTLSQIEIGDIKMHFEYFDINKLVQELIEQLEDQAEKKEVMLSIKPNNKQVLVYADYRRMYQVMNNLLTNAIKYNKGDGKVKVTMYEESDFVEIKVADTGEGIPQEHIGRIFERFYRVEQSRSRRGGGTGLGLAIVKHILEGHGTTMQVSSQVDKGSVFSFRLATEKEVMVENQQ